MGMHKSWARHDFFLCQAQPLLHSLGCLAAICSLGQEGGGSHYCHPRKFIQWSDLIAHVDQGFPRLQGSGGKVAFMCLFYTVFFLTIWHSFGSRPKSLCCSILAFRAC